jgi:hypothetical protein
LGRTGHLQEQETNNSWMGKTLPTRDQQLLDGSNLVYKNKRLTTAGWVKPCLQEQETDNCWMDQTLPTRKRDQQQLDGSNLVYKNKRPTIAGGQTLSTRDQQLLDWSNLAYKRPTPAGWVKPCLQACYAWMSQTLPTCPFLDESNLAYKPAISR